jgi:hypothetical protein
MTTLQNAVNEVEELDAVKTMALNYAMQNQSKLTYDTYLSLLESTAAKYDKDLADRKSKGRKINQHAVEMFDNGEYIEFGNVEDEEEEEEFPENIYDMSPSQFLSINKIYSKPRKPTDPNRPRIPKELYHKAPDKWKNMDLETIQLISDYCKGAVPSFNEEINQFKSWQNKGFQGKHQGQQSHSKFKANQHEVVWDDDVNVESEDEETTDYLIQKLINRGKKKPPPPKTRHPGDVRGLMSINKVSQETQDTHKEFPEGEDLHINGCIFRKINSHLLVTQPSSNTTYVVSNHKRIKALELALMDGGANGGVGGSNVRLLKRDPHRRATLTGMNEHQVNDVPIGTCAGKIKTKDGFIIGIMHQYAYLGTGATIHSKGQWQHFKNEVDDSSRKVGGKQ